MVGVTRADIVTFQFEGTVTSSNKLTAFPIGQPVIGRYSFDSTITDTNPGNAAQGIYNSVTSFSFTSGEVNAAAEFVTTGIFNSRELILINRFFSEHEYIVAVTCQNFFEDECLVEVNGEELSRMRILLKDSTSQAISNIDLPLSPPEISNFDTREFGLIFRFDPTDDPGVKFEITSLVKIDMSGPTEEVEDNFLLEFLPSIIRSTNSAPLK